MMIDGRSPILMLRLLRAAYWFDEALRRSLVARGRRSLPRAQSYLYINVVLGLRKPMQLAEAMGVSRQAVSRIIGDLVEAKVLRVSPDPEDGRGTLVELAPTPNDDDDDVLKIIEALERRVGRIVGDDRLGVLRTALATDWGEPFVVNEREETDGSSISAPE